MRLANIFASLRKLNREPVGRMPLSSSLVDLPTVAQSESSESDSDDDDDGDDSEDDAAPRTKAPRAAQRPPAPMLGEIQRRQQQSGDQRSARQRGRRGRRLSIDPELLRRHGGSSESPTMLMPAHEWRQSMHTDEATIIDLEYEAYPPHAMVLEEAPALRLETELASAIIIDRSAGWRQSLPRRGSYTIDSHEQLERLAGGAVPDHDPEHGHDLSTMEEVACSVLDMQRPRSDALLEWCVTSVHCLHSLVSIA